MTAPTAALLFAPPSWPASARRGVNALVTLLVWLLAAGVLAYWALKLWAMPTAPVRAPVAAAAPLQADPAAVARALGAAPTASNPAAPAPVQTNLSLQGVLTSGAEQLAVIAIEGKRARHYRVGAKLSDDSGDKPPSDALVLQTVDARSARLGHALDAPATVTLELPRPVRPDGLVPAPGAARPPVPPAPPNFTPPVLSTPPVMKSPKPPNNFAPPVMQQPMPAPVQMSRPDFAAPEIPQNIKYPDHPD